MAKKSKLAINIEYAALRIGVGLLNAMPYRMANSFARFMARITYKAFGFKRARTRERIMAAFPEKSLREIDEIAVGSLQTLLLNVVDMARAQSLDKAWMIKMVEEIERYSELVRNLAAEGHGVVVMVPHMGNWYMAAWALARLEVPLFAVAAAQRNPKINAWMNRQYGAGMDVVERGSATVMREILARLKDGQVFAILPDLRSPERDVEVPFLNATANVSHGGALFAVAAGSPIIVAAIRRERGHHTFKLLDILRPNPDAADRKDEAKRLTVEAMALINEEVKRTPEQWFWFNKRWLLQPVSD